MAEEKRPIAWGMWVIVAAVVVIGGLMSIRPDKVISDRLPEGLMAPDQLELAIYAELGDRRRELRGPDIRVPVGTRFRVRLVMSGTRKLSVGVLGADGSFKSALLSKGMPPGIHTFRKTLEVKADSDFTVMAGPPLPFEDARAGLPAPSVLRLRVRPEAAPTPAAAP